jgi:hypothetical protein
MGLNDAIHPLPRQAEHPGDLGNPHQIVAHSSEGTIDDRHQ